MKSFMNGSNYTHRLRSRWPRLRRAASLYLLLFSGMPALAASGDTMVGTMTGTVADTPMAATHAIAASSVLSLSIHDAIDHALNRNPVMHQSQARIAQAEGAVTEAKGNLLPRLDLSFSGMTSNNPLNVFGMKLNQRQASFNDFGAAEFFQVAGPNFDNLPQAFATKPDNLNHPGWYHNFQTSLKVSVPIYNGGKIREMKARAQAYLRAAQSGDQAARQRLIFEVVQAYAAVDTARAFTQVMNQAVAAAKSYRGLSKKLFDQGVVSKSDLLHAEVNLGDVDLRQKQADDQLANALDGLRAVTGLDAAQPIAVTDRLAFSAPGETLAEARNQALAHNPGLQALAEQIDAAHAGVSAARSVYRPHVNLMAQQDWNSENLGLRNDSYTIGGVVSWHILDFGARSGAVDRAQAEVNSALAKRQENVNKLVRQVGQIWRAAQLAAERVKVRSLAIKQNEEASRLEKLRYQQGLSTMTDLLQSQAELDKARAELVQARYQLTLQRAALLLAEGRLQPDQVQAQPLTAMNSHTTFKVSGTSDDAQH